MRVTENSGTIALTAGQRYDIRMEFYENGGFATARLLWSSPSTPKAAVPMASLYPSTPPPPSAILINFQPSAAPVPAGYLADGGLVYGEPRQRPDLRVDDRQHGADPGSQRRRTRRISATTRSRTSRSRPTPTRSGRSRS